MLPTFESQVERIIDIALEEDTGRGDITTRALIPPGQQGRAYMLVKEAGVVAGGEVAARVFARVDPRLKIETMIKDGTPVNPGDILLYVSGDLSGILKAERVAVNFIQRLSGIATATAQYVERVKGLKVLVVDTRKTTPGLRALEKYAVRMGGGTNHRNDLADAILIKDNHFAALRMAGISYLEAVAMAKRNAAGTVQVEAEAKTIQEAQEAAEAGADIVMLDNMSVDEMRQAVKLISGRVKIEASGGINLSTIRAVAKTGVDIISVGALTHSPRALDISLEIDPRTMKLI
jgi:nicotinate-nucleotide pyrophosphorylase (carboxylating)